MKKLLLIPIACLLMVLMPSKQVDAQVLDGIYVKEHVPARKPVGYKFLREADVMWSKRIWRMVDLHEKINHPLYYPTTPIGDRLSLIDLFLWGIKTEGLAAYSDEDDRFTQPIGRTQIEQKFGAVEKTITYQDENGNDISKTIKEEVTSSQVKQYILKEEWFFDKQHSYMDVRIIGVSPVRFYTPDDEIGGMEERRTKVFWIYFPDARRILANHEVYNQNNDVATLTYDDIFFKRKFGSYIIQEANVQDDRGIRDYSIGMQSLREAERIKKRMSDYEQDLWHY